MSLSQGTVLKNGKVIDSPSESSAPEDLNMAPANSNDSDTNDSSDISSQLSELKENYERKFNELHLEFSQLKDLMMMKLVTTVSHLALKVLQSSPKWGVTSSGLTDKSARVYLNTATGFS